MAPLMGPSSQLMLLPWLSTVCAGPPTLRPHRRPVADRALLSEALCWRSPGPSTLDRWSAYDHVLCSLLLCLCSATKRRCVLP